MRRQIKNSEVFLDSLIPLIRNLLVNNPNLNNLYFWNQSKSDFRDETIERAKCILERIENTKHLIEE